MAEAEDVITDVARHATIYAQDLWRRHRGAPARGAGRGHPRSRTSRGASICCVTAVFGTSYPIRVSPAAGAAEPARAACSATRDAPRLRQAVPATDGASIWLPSTFGDCADPAVALDRYRATALQQAMRAARGSATCWSQRRRTARCSDLYLLLEAHAADEAIARTLPGMARAIDRLRRQRLAARPALARFAPPRAAVRAPAAQAAAG